MSSTETKPKEERNTDPETDSTSSGGAPDEYDVDFRDDKIKPWAKCTPAEKAVLVLIVLIKLCIIAGALYFFICSLSFLADGFRLLGGKRAGEIFRNSEVFNNKVAGMLVGVLVTVLVQSSSTSTSIFITMVAAELLTVKQAIPLVMGANIGTSVTSTIVALGQVGDRNEFRRAFAAATVHDMFNFCSVLVLLPLEMITGYLYHLSKAIIDATPGLESGEKPPDILKKLTKPFTSEIIKVDKKLISKIAAAETQEELDELNAKRMLKHLFGNEDVDDIGSDAAVGTGVLIIALLILCVTLFVIVYLLKSILKGHIAVWLHKGVNGKVPDLKCGGLTVPMGWVSGYFAMLVGLGLTICVQSSSITTSALTPLVGVGVLHIERMYPTVLGANIGTCITGVLAALAADGSKLFLTLQVAYAHLFFNLSGIFMWYVIWPMRRFPIGAAKFLGDTAKYRWFALAYLFMCFFVIPAIIMGISIASDAAAIVVIVIAVLIALFVSFVNTLQARSPEKLPEKLRTWEWLPEPLRSLEPYDKHIFGPLGKVCICCKGKAVAPSDAK